MCMCVCVCICACPTIRWRLRLRYATATAAIVASASAPLQVICQSVDSVRNLFRLFAAAGFNWKGHTDAAIWGQASGRPLCTAEDARDARDRRHFHLRAHTTRYRVPGPTPSPPKVVRLGDRARTRTQTKRASVDNDATIFNCLYPLRPND